MRLLRGDRELVAEWTGLSVESLFVVAPPGAAAPEFPIDEPDWTALLRAINRHCTAATTASATPRARRAFEHAAAADLKAAGVPAGFFDILFDLDRLQTSAAEYPQRRERLLENTRQYLRLRPHESRAEFSERLARFTQRNMATFMRNFDLGDSAEALLRTLCTALAVRLYHLDRGNPPTSLDALVPAYLPALPRDPWTPDHPLRYRIHEGVPTIYSIGPNGNDDAGIHIAFSKEQDDIPVRLPSR